MRLVAISRSRNCPVSVSLHRFICQTRSLKDGTKPTPLLILETAIADADMCERLVTIFNDLDAANAETLTREIDKIQEG